MVAADARTAVTFSLSPGQAHDAPEGRKLLRRLGRQRASPALVMDRAYEGDETGSPDDAAVQVLCAGADDCQLKMELVHYFLTRRYKL